MMHSLTHLFLFDNKLTTLPFSLGSLFNLKVIGLEGNDISLNFIRELEEGGTRGLISYCRDQEIVGEFPGNRRWIKLEDERGGSSRKSLSNGQTIENSEAEESKDDYDVLLSSINSVAPTTPNLSSPPPPPPPAQTETFSVLSWNILCDKAATEAMFRYTPKWALDWNYRKEKILWEINEFGTDLINLQEMDQSSYEDYFWPALNSNGYEGVFQQKSRVRNFHESEKRSVDGCAVFWKANK
jgi:CCR4-NOT transcription complex subunit 6